MFGMGQYLPMLLKELDGLQKSLGLVNAATNGGAVDCDLLQATLLVDDEQASQGDSSILNQHSILCCNLLQSVRLAGGFRVDLKPDLAHATFCCKLLQVACTLVTSHREEI